MNAPDTLLTPAQAGVILGLSAKTLANLRSVGGGPRYVKLGPPPKPGRRDNRSVRYEPEALDEWTETMRMTRAS